MQNKWLPFILPRQRLVYFIFVPPVLELWLCLFGIRPHVELCLGQVNCGTVRACTATGILYWQLAALCLMHVHNTAQISKALSEDLVTVQPSFLKGRTVIFVLFLSLSTCASEPATASEACIAKTV